MNDYKLEENKNNKNQVSIIIEESDGNISESLALSS